MNSLNALIVEDDEAQGLLIKSYIEKTGILNYIGTCTSIDSLNSVIRAINVDLIFLDVMIEGENSIELLKSKQLNTPIIITSNFDFALQSFHLDDVVDYLLKPIEYSSFLHAVTKAVKKALVKPDNGVQEQNKKILIGDRSRKHNIDVKDITYVEAYGDYIKVNVSDGNVLVTKNTLKNFESLINNKDFIRIHRSYLVNKSYITEILTESVKINNIELPVSRANRKEVKSNFKKL